MGLLKSTQMLVLFQTGLMKVDAIFLSQFWKWPPTVAQSNTGAGLK
jgi:hypothetical protein